MPDDRSRSKARGEVIPMEHYVVVETKEGQSREVAAAVRLQDILRSLEIRRSQKDDGSIRLYKKTVSGRLLPVFLTLARRAM